MTKLAQALSFRPPLNRSTITSVEDKNIELPCAEKLAFDSKKQAEVAATVADYQRDVKLMPYKCQHCYLWHLKTVY